MALLNLTNTIDTILLDCENYEDYVNTYITTTDLRYLREPRLCRELLMLNYRAGKEVYSLKQFEAKRELLLEQLAPITGRLCYYGDNIRSVDPVLLQLAARERPNYQKILSTIIFLTHRDKNGFELSGFIDFEASLMRSNHNLQGATDWLGVFREKVKLRPKPHDLSFCDIHKGRTRYNSSENYIVAHDVKQGLTFVHRGDHKKICVSSTQGISERNYHRSVHFSNIYGYVIFYDHVVRKKI